MRNTQNKKNDFPRVNLSSGERARLSFKLSKDDETNNIKGGKLLISFGFGFATYYIDTLLENYKDYLNGIRLCIDDGSNLYVLNMNEIINFIIKNRYDIETELRGFKISDKQKEEIRSFENE